MSQSGTVVPSMSAHSRLRGVEEQLDFSGRFPFGIDQWAYVPFDVPPGTRRITVTTTHGRFSLFGVALNVLDLGMFGPAGHDCVEGFRGWSGGARDEFTLSAADATPGYLPGPIDSGRWELALGPVVLNPLGMSWEVHVTLERGVPLPEPTPSPVRAVVHDHGNGWYRGDLHLHTVHSDGTYHPEELAAVARTAGLDFIVSTEHNTNSANEIWSAVRTEGLLVVAGEEVTTRHGHWLAVGLSPHGWVDWRYAPRDDAFAAHAAGVRDRGGMVIAAHPAAPLPGSAWEFGYESVDALEVWNGLWTPDDEVALRIWHHLLIQGRRVAAVGGSDSHGPRQRVGRPHTVVHASDLSTPALVESLRGGRSYLAESAAVTMTLTAVCSVDPTATVGPGETLPVPLGATVTVCAAVSGAPDAVLALITPAGCVARAAVDASGAASLRWTTGDGGFARVEVRRRSRAGTSTMVALTNPVWFSPAAVSRTPACHPTSAAGRQPEPRRAWVPRRRDRKVSGQRSASPPR